MKIVKTTKGPWTISGSLLMEGRWCVQVTHRSFRSLGLAQGFGDTLEKATEAAFSDWSGLVKESFDEIAGDFTSQVCGGTLVYLHVLGTLVYHLKDGVLVYSSRCPKCGAYRDFPRDSGSPPRICTEKAPSTKL